MATVTHALGSEAQELPPIVCAGGVRSIARSDRRGSGVLLTQTDLRFILRRVPGEPDGRHWRKLTPVKCRIDAAPEPKWARIDAGRGLATADPCEPSKDSSEDQGAADCVALRNDVRKTLVAARHLLASIAKGLERHRDHGTVRGLVDDGGTP